jgi:cysteine desulfurase / selenocysteine lyase
MAASDIIDVAKIRRDFPVLATLQNGKPLTYLDSGATALKPSIVVDRVSGYLRDYATNVHRAVYKLGERATLEYEEVREKVKTFINAKSSKEVIFCAGTTEAVNMVAYGWGLKVGIKPGDEIITTVMEHHANLIPWYFLREVKGAVIKFLDINDDGTLKLEQLDELLTSRTKLVAVTQCSNVLGTINPIKEIAKKVHAAGALLLVDGAQSAPHMPVDVQDLDCDFFAFSAHKMLGPTGVGVLWGRESILEKMEPMLGGGHMIREVKQGFARWNELPAKLEAGTPNVAGVIGLGAAIDYLQEIGMKNVRAHEVAIGEYALGKLREVQGLRVYGPQIPSMRGGLVSFSLDAAHPHDISSILDSEAAVCTRAGHHCCQPLMQRLGISATARASFHIYTTEDEVDRLCAALKKVNELFM